MSQLAMMSERQPRWQIFLFPFLISDRSLSGSSHIEFKPTFDPNLNPYSGQV